MVLVADILQQGQHIVYFASAIEFLVTVVEKPVEKEFKFSHLAPHGDGLLVDHPCVSVIESLSRFYCCVLSPGGSLERLHVLLNQKKKR